LSPAALPPTPIDDAPPDVPAVPTLEAEVPPEAALPPLPMVAEPEAGEDDMPPEVPPPAPPALCASTAAPDASSAASDTAPSFNEDLIVSSYFLFELV